MATAKKTAKTAATTPVAHDPDIARKIWLAGVGAYGRMSAETQGAVEKLALALQAAALVKKAPDFVAEAFVAARIDHPALTYGATAASFDDRAVLERACLTN